MTPIEPTQNVEAEEWGYSQRMIEATAEGLKVLLSDGVLSNDTTVQAAMDALNGMLVNDDIPQPYPDRSVRTS